MSARAHDTASVIGENSVARCTKYNYILSQDYLKFRAPIVVLIYNARSSFL